MKRMLWTILACFLLTSCSPALTEVPKTEADSGKRAALDAETANALPGGWKATNAADSDPPDEIVGLFLQAAQAGEPEQARYLLTQTAQEQTQRLGLTIDPPGTPSMSYEILPPEFPSDDENSAWVRVNWRENFDTSNSSESAEVVWSLRRETDGWRISGMWLPQPDGEYASWSFEKTADLEDIKRQVDLEPAVEQEPNSDRESADNPTRQVSGSQPLDDPR